MAEILPTPTTGSWQKIDAFAGPWTPQPATGSWQKIDAFAGPWTPQPATGSWQKIDAFDGWRKGGWHVGRVVF